MKDVFTLGEDEMSAIDALHKQEGKHMALCSGPPGKCHSGRFAADVRDKLISNFPPGVQDTSDGRLSNLDGTRNTLHTETRPLLLW